MEITALQDMISCDLVHRWRCLKNIEAARSTETSVKLYQPAHNYITEDGNLYGNELPFLQKVENFLAN
jgi:hypothetical protein